MSANKVILILTIILVVAGSVYGGLIFFKSRGEKADPQVGPTASSVEIVPPRPAASAPPKPVTQSRFDQAARVLDPPPYDRKEPGEVLVMNPPKDFGEKVGSFGFRVIEVQKMRALDIEIFLLEIPQGSTIEEAKRLLASRFPGASVDANPVFGLQGLDEYRASLPRPQAGWNPPPPQCGAGLRIGMIDGGVDVNHPALKGQRVEYVEFNRDGRRPGPADHGTAVAAIMVGKPEWGGLVPGAELMAVNMFEYNEADKIVGNGMAMLKGLDWLASKGVQVINLSVAGGDNKVVREAMEVGRKKGMVMVGAAGNWGSDTRPAYPAAYSDVVAVTAFDHEKNVYVNANRGKYIDFAAPGVKMYTAVPEGGRIQSGTSFAAPYVSVLIAIAVEKGAPRSPAALRDLLVQRVVDMGAPGRDDVFGWGFVNIEPPCQ